MGHTLATTYQIHGAIDFASTLCRLRDSRLNNGPILPRPMRALTTSEANAKQTKQNNPDHKVEQRRRNNIFFLSPMQSAVSVEWLEFEAHLLIRISSALNFCSARQ
jgi:hypothetical protein